MTVFWCITWLLLCCSVMGPGRKCGVLGIFSGKEGQSKNWRSISTKSGELRQNALGYTKTDFWSRSRWIRWKIEDRGPRLANRVKNQSWVHSTTQLPECRVSGVISP
jgi:hypothetical protein